MSLYGGFLLFLFLIYVDNRRQFEGRTLLLYGILYSAERLLRGGTEDRQPDDRSIQAGSGTEPDDHHSVRYRLCDLIQTLQSK